MRAKLSPPSCIHGSGGNCCNNSQSAVLNTTQSLVLQYYFSYNKKPIWQATRTFSRIAYLVVAILETAKKEFQAMHNMCSKKHHPTFFHSSNFLDDDPTPKYVIGATTSIIDFLHYHAIPDILCIYIFQCMQYNIIKDEFHLILGWRAWDSQPVHLFLGPCYIQKLLNLRTTIFTNNNNLYSCMLCCHVVHNLFDTFMHSHVVI